MTIGPIPRLSRTPLLPGQPLRPSIEGREILEQIGMGDKVESLLGSGALVVCDSQQLTQ